MKRQQHRSHHCLAQCIGRRAQKTRKIFIKTHLAQPAKKNSCQQAGLSVADEPIIPFITGDGIGIDIMPVMIKVVNSAVEKAYQHKRKIAWQALPIGTHAMQQYGTESVLPASALETLKKHPVAIKGPLATPVGEGMRSLNVLLRQQLDLFICLRPVRYFAPIAAPVKFPQQVDMVIFRENIEDLYAGIEWPPNSSETAQLSQFLKEKLAVKQLPLHSSYGLGLKVCSEMGSKRLVRAAIFYALKYQRRTVTLVHKGNIMKYTEGAFKKWGYEVAIQEFGAQPLPNNAGFSIIDGEHRVLINDVIADNFLQQILLNPQQFDVIATMNLNGDYISDALAAQVGGLGLAPGANIGEKQAIFEATHGTAPAIAGLDRANPCSLILSAEMMLRYINWPEAADILLHVIQQTLLQGIITADLALEIESANICRCREFGQHLVDKIVSLP